MDCKAIKYYKDTCNERLGRITYLKEQLVTYKELNTLLQNNSTLTNKICDKLEKGYLYKKDNYPKFPNIIKLFGIDNTDHLNELQSYDNINNEIEDKISVNNSDSSNSLMDFNVCGDTTLNENENNIII
jgi:hypothetical protein